MTCGIYKITNKLENKYYVGSSKGIEQRWYQHKYLLRNNKHYNTSLQSSWNLYGEKAFVFSIEQHVNNEEDLQDFEQWYLDRALMEQDKNYNLSFKAYSIQMTLETRQKIGQGNKGKILSLQTREKMRKAHIGIKGISRFGEENPMYNKNHTDETKLKIKMAVAGKLVGNKNGRFDNKKYHFFNLITSEQFIGTRFEFYSKFKLNKGVVCQLISGKAKSHKNWILKNSEETA